MFIIMSSTPAQDSSGAIVQRIHGASKGAFELFFVSQEFTQMQGRKRLWMIADKRSSHSTPAKNSKGRRISTARHV